MIRIKKIVLKNYRQYIGKQEISFPVRKDRNLTIIVGVNGAGKTNLLNAVTWCLYGREEQLAESSLYHPMLNDSVTASLKIGETAEASVEIFYEEEDSNDEFRIFRSARFRKDKEGVTLVSSESSGWIKISPRKDWIERDTDFIVNYRILPFGVRDFFFFDGERLIKFFEEETAEKVKSAILHISEISLIETAARHLQGKKSELMGQVAKVSPKTHELNEEREARQKGLEELEREIQEFEKNKREIDRLLEEVERKLRGFSEERVKELTERERELKEKIGSLEGDREKLSEQFVELIVNGGPLALAGKALDFTADKIKEKYTKGELPPKVKDIFLRELLEKSECICGTDISKGKGRKKILQELESSSFATKLDDSVRTIRYDLDGLLKSKKSFLERKHVLGGEIKELERNLEKSREDLKGVGSRLKEMKIEKIQSLVKQRGELRKTRDRLIEDLAVKNTQKEHSQRKIRELESDIKKETKKEKKLTAARNRIEICEKAIDFLSGVKEEILEETRSTVEKKTFDYFHGLIWKKKKFRSIGIDEAYVVTVVDRYNQNIIGALSAGEREILALAFMAALRGVSGFAAPILIDTPLARISGEHRISIAECLPNYLKDAQLVLLLTDQEYTESVKKILKPRVGIGYLLQYDDVKDETRVKEYGS